jgi:predicted RNase H-like HicB family nuclease
MAVENFVVYPAVFELETDPAFEDTYNISFPDVPGALSYAKGFKHAMYNAGEALGLMLYDADVLPETSRLEDIQKEFPNAEVHLIGVDLSEVEKDVTVVEPKVKKNTSIPKTVATQAESLGINFSAVLTKALKQEIHEAKAEYGTSHSE